MVCPDFYYKKLLHDFALCLAIRTYADFWPDMKSEEELKDFILTVKRDVDKGVFFFDAGWTCRMVAQDAIEDGTNSFIALMEGGRKFERFIGIPDEEEVIM